MTNEFYARSGIQLKETIKIVQQTNGSRPNSQKNGLATT